MNKRHCAGCRNDRYNYGEDAAKTQQCWLLATAQLCRRRPVPAGAKPPFTQPVQRMPSCYQREGIYYFSV